MKKEDYTALTLIYRAVRLLGWEISSAPNERGEMDHMIIGRSDVLDMFDEQLDHTTKRLVKNEEENEE